VLDEDGSAFDISFSEDACRDGDVKNGELGDLFTGHALGCDASDVLDAWGAESFLCIGHAGFIYENQYKD
jgi:hypothetical protein